MTTTARRTARTTALVGSTALAAALAIGLPATSASAAPAGVPGADVMTSTSLLLMEEVTTAGVPVDGASLDATGNATLESITHTSSGCLSDKTMRAITGAKSAPAPGVARAYFDGRYTSLATPSVSVQLAIAQGRTDAATNRFVSTLRSGITTCKPANGHTYDAARTYVLEAEQSEWYVERDASGAVVGGAAIVRHGTRFGYVNLAGGNATALKHLAISAAIALDRTSCTVASASAAVATPDGC